MGKLLVVNGSPHRNGHTRKALDAVARHLCEKFDFTIIMGQLPVGLAGCCHCEKCLPRCRYQDEMQLIIDEIGQSEVVLIGSPVHLDLPTAQIVAFLQRLNCMAEPTGRTFFRGKKVYLLATAYCSGTKAVISAMMNACEMLGFDIPGRSSYEHVELWKDGKIRGGLPGPGIWLKTD